MIQFHGIFGETFSFLHVLIFVENIPKNFFWEIDKLDFMIFLVWTI